MAFQTNIHLILIGNIAFDLMQNILHTLFAFTPFSNTLHTFSCQFIHSENHTRNICIAGPIRNQKHHKFKWNDSRIFIEIDLNDFFRFFAEITLNFSDNFLNKIQFIRWNRR